MIPLPFSLPLAFIAGGMLVGCGPRDAELARAKSEAAGSAASVRLLDLAGQPVSPFKGGHAKALVFLFVSTDCPISNGYVPEIKRLHTCFTTQGAAFWLVYPNPDTTAPEVKTHLKDYSYGLAALRDPQHALVKFSGATVTPEAAVFAPDGRLLYRGRIDDRFPVLGIQRAAPTQRDLEEALTAVLGNKPVAQQLTRAIGCYIAELP